MTHVIVILRKHNKGQSMSKFWENRNRNQLYEFYDENVEARLFGH